MKNFHNNNDYNCRRSKGERGVALIAALFALMLISALALAMVFSTTTESAVNANFKDSEVAEYAAHAGIQEGRERLIDTGNVGDYLNKNGANNIPTQLPAAVGGGVLYITNPAQGEVVQPQFAGSRYFDTELCHDNFVGLGLANVGNNVPCGAPAPAGAIQAPVASSNPATGQAWALGYKWVRITQKANLSAGANWLGVNPAGPNTVPVCWDKAQNRQVLLPVALGYVSCDQDPIGATDPMRTVYMLTSLAVTQRGTRRMAQAEVALDPPIAMNAAVMSDDNVTLNGSLTVSGFDNCSCSCSGSKAAYSCTDRVGHACNGSKMGIFASGSIQNPTGANEQVYSGLGTGGGIAYEGNNTLPKSGPFPYKVQDLVNQYSQLPGVVDVTKDSNYNWTCSSGDCGTHSGPTLGQAAFPLSPPDNPNGMVPQITYVPGNVSITSNATGSGILIVNGDLNLQGGMQFYGLILVSGSVHFNGGGAAAVNLYGGLLSGDPVDDTTTLGGSVSIQYDYCALNKANKGQAPRTLAMRELSY